MDTNIFYSKLRIQIYFKAKCGYEYIVAQACCLPVLDSLNVSSINDL